MLNDIRTKTLYDDPISAEDVWQAVQALSYSERIELASMIEERYDSVNRKDRRHSDFNDPTLADRLLSAFLEK